MSSREGEPLTAKLCRDLVWESNRIQQQAYTDNLEHMIRAAAAKGKTSQRFLFGPQREDFYVDYFTKKGFTCTRADDGLHVSWL